MNLPIWLSSGLTLVSLLAVLPSQAAFAQSSLILDTSLRPLAQASSETNSDVPVEGIRVNKIQVVGSTVFSSAQLEAVVSPFEGKTLSKAEVEQAVNAVTQLYLNQGYLTSRAILESQPLQEGVLEIKVVEGTAIIELDWLNENHRLPDAYIRDRLKAALYPLNVPHLEDQLKLLKADPLLETVEASLRNSRETEDIVTVRVREARSFYGEASFDNYSPPSIGGERFGTTFGLRNLSGFGDNLAATYHVSTTGGSHSLDLSYRLPVNAKDGTVQLRAALDFTKITQDPFDALRIRGDRQLYELVYRQPILRSSQQELALFAGFAYTEGQTFIFDNIATPFGFGPDQDGVSRTSVFKLGQEYLRRDNHGAWFGRSQFNFGLGILDATDNPSPIPDGQFFSWIGQFQRIQRLSRNHLLILQSNMQFTPHSLLPSEQFSLGGGQSVRGYRQNVLIGDNGLRFSVEDRITVRRDSGGDATLQIAPFLDAGAVLNAHDNPNSLSQNQNVIAGLGLGVLWNPLPDFDLRVDYGLSLVDLNDEGDSLQDYGLYFLSNYKF